MSTKKVEILVRDCLYCPWSQFFEGAHPRCGKTGKIIQPTNKLGDTPIPVWCPLEDAPQDDTRYLA